MVDSNISTTRRKFLRTTGAAAGAAALAGCSGGSGDSGGGNAGNDTAGGGGDGGDAGTTAGTEGGERNDSAGTDTDRETESGDGGGDTGGTLNLVNASMTTLDPVAASDTASSEVTTQLFDGLMHFPNGGIPVKPLLAKGYEISDDFLTYTFTLKEGAQFHDGTEVTANDFVYAYERLAGSPNSRDAADILDAVGINHERDSEGSYEPGTLATEAVDDYTFRFEISQPFHAALQLLSNDQFGALPEGIVGDVEGYEGEMPYGEFASENPVGAGPFTLEQWESGTSAAVSRFENYHGSGPKIDGVQWQMIEDSTAVYNYAMEGNADVFDIPTANYSASKVSIERTDDQGREFGTYGPLRNGETANYLGVPTLSVFYLGFRMPQVPKPVRQAVAYALNQNTTVEKSFKGRGVPAYHYSVPSVYPGGAQAYEQHAKQQYPYGYNETRVDEARRVMEEAGYSQEDKYELELTMYQSKTWQETAKRLRDKLASAHIAMTIQQAQFSTLLTRVRNGSVQMFTLGWIVPWAAPDAFVKHLNPRTSSEDVKAQESYNNWSTDGEAAQKAISAWEQVQNNTAPTDSAQQARNEAYVAMEEANWAAVANLPVYHETTSRFWYDSVDIPPFGTAGDYKQKFNEVTISN
jgi:peptide/nickel transport system substrate-binding protein